MAKEPDRQVLSLGWQVALWLEANVFVPAGPRRGKLIRLTSRQVQFLNAVYQFEIIDGNIERAQRVVDHAQLMESKGSGKSPMMAGIAIAELGGPVIPHHIDDEGDLCGIENPDAFCALGANSEEQVKGTTWKALRSMLKQGDSLSPFAERTGVDVGKTRILMPDDRVIQYCSSSGDSGEGWTISWFGAEETAKARAGNGGIDFIETMSDNAGKARHGWMMESTNAPVLGEGAYAERTWLSEKDGKDGLFIFQPRGLPVEDIRGEENKEEVIEAMRACYGEEECRPAPDGWVNLESKWRAMQKTTVARARRLFLNEVRKSEDKLADPERWHAWWDPGKKIPDGARVALGFDGSETRDSTVLWAVDVDTMHGQEVGVWHRELGDDKATYQIPRGEIDAAAYAAFERWHVVGFGADRAAGWGETIDRWTREWGKVEFEKVGKRSERGRVLSFMWNNSYKNVHRIVEFFEMLMEQDEDDPPFTHNGNDVITDHVNNMIKVTKRGTYTAVDKASDGLYGQIDGGIAVMLALYVAAKIKQGRPTRPSGGGLSTFDRLMGTEPEGDEGAPQDQSAFDLAASLGELL